MDDRRRFVVLEHRWDGVHWDFLVEVGRAGRCGPGRSTPSRSPGVDLPARALADHRRAYLITRGRSRAAGGRSGGGTRGRAPSRSGRTDRVRLVLDGRQLVGPVELWASPSAGGASAGMARPRGRGAARRLDVPPREVELKDLAGRQGRAPRPSRGWSGRRGGSGPRGSGSARGRRRRGSGRGCSGPWRPAGRRPSSSGRRGRAPAPAR